MKIRVADTFVRVYVRGSTYTMDLLNRGLPLLYYDYEYQHGGRWILIHSATGVQVDYGFTRHTD